MMSAAMSASGGVKGIELLANACATQDRIEALRVAIDDDCRGGLGSTHPPVRPSLPPPLRGGGILTSRRSLDARAAGQLG